MIWLTIAIAEGTHLVVHHTPADVLTDIQGAAAQDPAIPATVVQINLGCTGQQPVVSITQGEPSK